MEVNFFQLDVYYFPNVYVISSLISISLDIYNSLDPEATESGTRPIFLSGFKLYTLYSILSQLCSLYYFNSRARGHFSCLGWNLLRRKPFSEAAALSQTWFVLYSTRRSLLLFPPVLSQCTCREREGFINPSGACDGSSQSEKAWSVSSSLRVEWLTLIIKVSKFKWILYWTSISS